MYNGQACRSMHTYHSYLLKALLKAEIHVFAFYCHVGWRKSEFSEKTSNLFWVITTITNAGIGKQTWVGVIVNMLTILAIYTSTSL